MGAADVETADRALFDRIARDYVRKDLNEGCRIAREHRLRQTVLPLGRDAGHLLEIGCGAGFSARYLAGLYDTYTGVDYSNELVRYAQRYSAGPQREFVCANVREFVPVRRFDVILMVGVLHHMPDPGGVLEQVRSWLAPGGVVAVNEPQRGNPAVSGLRWLRKRVDRRYSADQVEFSEDELRGLFEGSGYVVHAFPQGVLSTPFAETQFLPGRVLLPLARFAARVDPWLERAMAGNAARALAWNVVVLGSSAGTPATSEK